MALKPKRPMKIESLRVITRDDLPRLVQKRNYISEGPQKLRESHHWIARLLAMGKLTYRDIAKHTGYSESRIGVLAATPAMKELVAKYHDKFDHSFMEVVQDFGAIATANLVHAERMLRDRLHEADEEGETIPVRDLIAIVSDRADRFGYNKKTTNVNINVELAGKMEGLRRRDAKVINGTAVPELKTLGDTPRVVLPSQTNSIAPTETPARPFSSPTPNSVRRV